MLGPLLMMGASGGANTEKTLNVEVSDGFNRSNATPMDGNWQHTLPTSRWTLTSKRALFDTSTSNAGMRHTVQISAGSQFVQVDSAEYGTEVALRVTGTTTSRVTGYSAGRVYYSGSDWAWYVLRNGTMVADGGQTPFVNPSSQCLLRLELVDNGNGTVTLTLYVDGTEACSYTDGSPLTDTQYAGVYGDGRGSAQQPDFDNFQAGSISYEAPITIAPTLFSDDFNRSNEAIETSANWSITGGDGDVVSNELVMFGTAPFPFVIFDDPSGLVANDDHFAEVTVVDGADSTDPIGAGNVNQQCGLVARRSDANNYYWARYIGAGDNTWQIDKVVGGSSTTVGTLGEAPPAFPFKIRLEAAGTTIRLLVDDGAGWVEKISVTDAALSSGTVGIFAYGSSVAPIKTYYDDFKAGDT